MSQPFRRLSVRLSKAQRTALQALRTRGDWMTASEVAAATDMERSAARRAVERLQGNLPLTPRIERVETHPNPRPLRWRLKTQPKRR